MHDVAVAIHLGQLGEDDLIRLPAVLFATAEAGDAVSLSLIEHQAEEVTTMAVTAIGGWASTPATMHGIPVVSAAASSRPGTRCSSRRSPAVWPLAPSAVARVVDAPPVTGAALLGFDYLGADSSAETRLRASYNRSVSPGR